MRELGPRAGPSTFVSSYVFMPLQVGPSALLFTVLFLPFNVLHSISYQDARLWINSGRTRLTGR